MTTIIAIIEKSEGGGYGIYSSNVNGLFGYGETEVEAKESFKESIESQIEFLTDEKKEIPSVLRSNIIYKYDISGFFLAFPFINATAFAKEVGINPSLMRMYKERIKFASEAQKSVIQNKFNTIQNRLSVVQF